MKKKFLICLIALVFIALTACDTQSAERMKKDAESSRNGLERILEVYSADGKLIKTYQGKFDIEASTDGSGTKVKFDLPMGDGKETKRIIIYNALVVCEEK